MSEMPERVWLCDSQEGSMYYDGVSYWAADVDVDNEAHPHEYIRADLVPKWIPVGERLPEGTDDTVYYACYHPKTHGREGGHISFCTAKVMRFIVFEAGKRGSNPKPITHWQPLPEYPTEGI